MTFTVTGDCNDISIVSSAIFIFGQSVNFNPFQSFSGLKSIYYSVVVWVWRYIFNQIIL